MENEHPLHYFKNGLTIGLGLGFAGGIFSTIWLKKRQAMNADDVLDNIKAAFIKEGPIEGSWISFDTEHLQKFAITMDVLSGGITRAEDDQLVAYEFFPRIYWRHYPHRRRAACHL